MSALCISIQGCIVDTSQGNRARKRIGGIYIGMEKLHLFSDHVILYIEKS